MLLYTIPCFELQNQGLLSSILYKSSGDVRELDDREHDRGH